MTPGILMTTCFIILALISFLISRWMLSNYLIAIILSGFALAMVGMAYGCESVSFSFIIPREYIEIIREADEHGGKFLTALDKRHRFYSHSLNTEEQEAYKQEPSQLSYGMDVVTYYFHSSDVTFKLYTNKLDIDEIIRRHKLRRMQQIEQKELENRLGSLYYTKKLTLELPKDGDKISQSNLSLDNYREFIFSTVEK